MAATAAAANNIGNTYTRTIVIYQFALNENTKPPIIVTGALNVVLKMTKNTFCIWLMSFVERVTRLAVLNLSNSASEYLSTLLNTRLRNTLLK